MTENFSATDLDAAIRALELRQKEAARSLKAEFEGAVESVKPLNLIKTAIEQVKGSAEVRGNLLNTAVGLGAGFISKKAFVGFSRNPLKRMVGTALMFGVTNIVAKNPLIVRMAAIGLMKLLKRKPAEKPIENGSLDHIGSSFYMK